MCMQVLPPAEMLKAVAGSALSWNALLLFSRPMHLHCFRTVVECFEGGQEVVRLNVAWRQL